jgi:DNA-binding response OmpR family regulator
MAHTVLVVEDEAKIRDLLRSYLEREGWSVLTTGSGAEAITMASSARPDLVLLDLGLPDVPGEAVAAELRRLGDIPVLILTARASEQDRVAGLELGADDYVTKPFSPREVTLRAKAILRRVAQGAEAGDQASFNGGRLVIDNDRHEVSIDGRLVALTPTEWGVLTALASSPGRVYSRLELLNRVRGFELASERTIDSHVKNLRRKVEDDPSDPRVVETVLGAGYRLGVQRDG